LEWRARRAVHCRHSVDDADVRISGRVFDVADNAVSLILANARRVVLRNVRLECRLRKKTAGMGYMPMSADTSG
jgi:hypothetical protein